MGILPALGRLLFSSAPQPQLYDLPAPAIPPSRIRKLDIDSSMFHPSGAKWLSELLTHSLLNDFTISLKPSTAAHFTSHGLAILLKVARGLQSLTVLNATPEDVQNISPRLRPFLALKSLTICLASYDSNSAPSFTGSATPFAPANLQRLSVSAALVSYMLLGTVTALSLRELEIVYGKDDDYVPQDIVAEIASVRDFFDRISVPIAIAVRLACTGRDDSDHVGQEDSLHSRNDSPDPISPSFIDALNGMKARRAMAYVDKLSLELYPRVLRCLQPGDFHSIVDLVGCFRNVTKVVVEGVRHFREAHNREATVFREEVVKTIVYPIYSKCSGLRSLWIGEEEFLRPLIEL